MYLVEVVLQLLAGHAVLAQIHQHDMVVGAAGYELVTALCKAVSQRLAVLDDLLGIRLELGLHGFLEANRLRRDNVHQRAALHTGEQRLVDRLGVLFLAQDHTAAGTAKGLMSGGGDKIGIWYGVLMLTAGYQARDMRHIDHQQRADLITDLTELFEIDRARISGSAADDHLRLAFLGDLEHLIIIDAVGHGINAVADKVEVLSAEIDR